MFSLRMPPSSRDGHGWSLSLPTDFERALIFNRHQRRLLCGPAGSALPSKELAKAKSTKHFRWTDSFSLFSKNVLNSSLRELITQNNTLSLWVYVSKYSSISPDMARDRIGNTWEVLLFSVTSGSSCVVIKGAHTSGLSIRAHCADREPE